MNLPLEVKTAIDILEAANFKAYCVGGCVRDSLMNIAPHDYDLTTNATPEEILNAFNEYKCLTVGIKHGTVTVIIENTQLEITTFRIDGEYKDNRRPENVIFSSSLKDDTKRRDFTVNAIAYSPNEGYIDHHNGINDIENKIIRCVGEPSKRFNEDGLRILRALRFASCLGFKIDTETAKAIHNQKHLLNNIAKERIFTEFTKLICGKNAKDILFEFKDVIEVFIPEISKMFGFEQNNIHHCYDVYMHTLVSLESIESEPLLRWVMLLHDTGKPHTYSEDDKGGHFHGHYKISAEIAETVLKRLKASNEFTDKVSLLVYRHDTLTPETEKSVKRLLMKIGYENAKLLFKINRADAKAQAKFQIEERLERINRIEAIADSINSKNECYTKSDMDISGKDLILVGIPQGKVIGNILEQLLLEVVDKTVENKKEALIKRALELFDPKNH